MVNTAMIAMANSTPAKVAADVETKVAQGFDFIEQFNRAIINNGPDVLAGVILFVVGIYISRFLRNLVERVMLRAAYDKTGISFVGQIVYYVLLIVFFIAALNRIGLPTNSFIAGFGAFALAIGLALQSNMANFASGMLILLFKPFKAGDWVSVNGVEGSVQSIQMLNTMIITKENRAIFIPNSIITSEKVMNSTYMPTRYIFIEVDISYNNDHHEAMRVIKEIFMSDSRILNADHVEIGIKSFGDNAVKIVTYPLVEASNYLKVYYHIMSEIKDNFDALGIEIPYPQRVVYVNESEKRQPHLKGENDKRVGTSVTEEDQEDEVEGKI